MEVIYLITHAKQTGPVNQALNILTGLNRVEGVHASLLTLEPEIEANTWLQRFRENNIDIVQFNLHKWDVIGCVVKLRDLIKKRHIDVIHSSGYKADFINMMVRRNVTTVSTQRSLPTEVVEKLPKLIRPVLEKIHLSIIKKMDHVVACSKALQRVFVEQYGMNVLAVQNAVNTDFFTPASLEKKGELRKELCLPIDNSVYLVLGSLRERKNVGLIIQAFKEINDNRIQLMIVGDGPDRDELSKIANTDSRIKFIGSTSRPKDYLQASDFLVSSALAEGLPNTVLEALSCGLIPILSDIEPHKELVENTSVEHIFEKRSKEELKTNLVNSLSWNKEIQSKEARRVALSTFDIDSLAKNYISIYTSSNKH